MSDGKLLSRESNNALRTAQEWTTRLYKLWVEIQNANPDRGPTKLENLVQYAWEEAGEECERIRARIDIGPPTREEPFNDG